MTNNKGCHASVPLLCGGCRARTGRAIPTGTPVGNHQLCEPVNGEAGSFAKAFLESRRER